MSSTTNQLQEYVEENWPSERWRNISFQEWACSYSGKCLVDEIFLDKVQRVRNQYGRPLIITSGYRSEEHPVEAKKDSRGAHTFGRALDIKVHGHNAWELLDIVMEEIFLGVGISKRGDVNSRFIHLDDMTDGEGFPRPWIWSY